MGIQNTQQQGKKGRIIQRRGGRTLRVHRLEKRPGRRGEARDSYRGYRRGENSAGAARAAFNVHSPLMGLKKIPSIKERRFEQGKLGGGVHDIDQGLQS